MIDKVEAKARSTPGYQPYQPPDESRLNDAQRKHLESVRSASAARNEYVFVIIDAAGVGTTSVAPLADSPIAKQFPQLTREDLGVFEKRYVQAMAESALAGQRTARAAYLEKLRRTQDKPAR